MIVKPLWLSGTREIAVIQAIQVFALQRWNNRRRIAVYLRSLKLKLPVSDLRGFLELVILNIY